MTTRALLLVVLALGGLALATPAHAVGVDPADRQALEAAVDQVGDVSCGSLVGAACQRQRGPAPRSDWRFLVAPYGWLASVKGTVVSEGQEGELDIPFSDITKHVNGGFQLYAEARWKKWFVAFDGTWANLVEEVGGNFVDVDVNIRQRLFDVRLGYEVFRCSRDGALDPCCESYRRWVVMDAFVGVRYWYTQQILTVQGPRGFIWKTDGLDERLDPFLGLRFGFDVTRRIGVFVRGDVGGFGIGNAARFAWQAQGGVSLDLTRWMHLILGWRALYFDTIEGSGAGRNGAALTQQGPIIGLGFTF